MHRLSTWVQQMWPAQKASSVAPYIAYNHVGKPVWTPRNYKLLAEEGYQKNVVVYRCVQLISRGLASVPLTLYRKDHECDIHPLRTLLQRPSPRQSGMAFMESIASHLLLAGNAYIEGVFGNAGKPLELYALRPDRMQIVPGANGLPQAFEYKVNGRTRSLESDPVTGHSSVLHIKNFNPLNDWYGMSPIEAAARSIDQHNVVAEHNLALLQNGGRPSGALVFKPGVNARHLTDAQRMSLRQDLQRVYEGSANAGRIMLLEGDCHWQEMGLSPKDLDFIEGKSFSAREISQAFGVPPMLVGIPGDATFANFKEARYHLWEETIIPLLELIIDELNLWLCPFFGEELLLSYDPDSIAALALRRETTWAKVASADFLTVNEKRQAVGYSPLPNGDVLSDSFITSEVKT